MADDKMASGTNDSVPNTPEPIVQDRDALKLEVALGHKQALSRNFGLFSLTSLGIVIAK